MTTYTKILYQVVFGSKKCINFLTEENQNDLYKYIAGVLRNKKCFTYIVGGHKNHIHMVFSLHPAQTLAQVISDVKKASELMMHNEKNRFMRFAGWQVGYGAFTYSSYEKDILIKYVENQNEHHRKVSFMEELIGFLKEYGVDYNEKYLFV